MIATANGRIAQVGAAQPENEQVALYDTMFAGTYSVEADKVSLHIDIS